MSDMDSRNGDDAGASITEITQPASGAPVAAAVPSAAPTPGATTRPKGMVRWAVALLVVAFLIGASSVAAVMLTGAGTPSAVEGWIPKGTIAWMEVRGDLPGDQKAKVGDILARFPGFKDQSTLDVKVDEAFNRVLETSGLSYSGDLKPWLAGDTGIAISAGALQGAGMYGMMGAGALGSAAPKAADTPVTDRALAIIAVKDGAAAEAFLASKLGGTPTVTQYAGGNLTTLTRGSATIAWATRGGVLLLGFVDNVKAALDTAGSGDFAKSAQFVEAKKVAPTTYLAYGYLDAKAYMDAALAGLQGKSTGNTAMDDAMACVSGQAQALMAPWESGYVQARDAALYMEARQPAVDMGYTPVDAVSTVTGRLPASTVFSARMGDFGGAASAAWTLSTKMLACSPQLKSTLDQVQSALGAVGGVDGILGWAGDTSIAVTRAGTTWAGGLASVAKDPAGASRAFTQIQALLSLAGSQAGITSNLVEYAGGKMITITVPAAGGKVPELAIGLRDDLFLLGTADFVKATFDTPSGAGLAAQPRYQKAIGMVGAKSTSELYVDITGIREGVEALISQQAPDRYAAYVTDTKPFLEPIESLVFVANAPSNGMSGARGALVFK
jgi:hypothetical protein